MLQSIREHTQGWIAGVVISVIILSFALWGVHSYFIGGGNNNVVAEVNGVEITREQLTVAYERLRRQVQAQYGSNNPLNTKDETVLKDRALRALVDVEVLKQASAEQGFQISNQQIDNYLQSMPEFRVEGQFSIERFQEVLSSILLTTSEFLDLIKTSLLIDQPKLGILFTSFALPDETDYTISLVNQDRYIEYILLPLQHFLAKPTQISAERIRTYYEKNKNDFMTPEQVNIEYLELSVKDVAAKINPTEALLKNFYNENINAYTQPMTWKLMRIEIPILATATQEELNQQQTKVVTIMQSLTNGEAFAKVASRYPNNISELGWLSLNQVPLELQKEVANLTKRGQFTQPIKTNNAMVIVGAVDIKEPKIQTFEEIKNKVHETYIHQQAEEKFVELREQLANAAYEHPDSLQFASKTLNLPIQTSELFAKDKVGKDISQYKKIRDVAFSRDVLEMQNNSDVIQVSPEMVIVLRVKSHIASTLLPLSGISQQIADKLKAQEAEVQAEKFVQELLMKLKSGEDPQKIAQSNGLQWIKVGEIGRYSNKVDPAILDMAFSLANPKFLKNNKSYGTTKLTNGYAIVAVDAVRSGTVPNPKQYAIFAEQIQNSEGLLEYELYKQSQIADAKIEIQQG